MNNGYLLVVEL